MKNKHKCFIPVLKGPILPLAPGQSCWTYAYDGRVVILAGLLTFTISIFFSLFFPGFKEASLY